MSHAWHERGTTAEHAWPSIAAGQRSNSNRSEMLLWLNTHQTPVPDGAVRVGKYKLIQKSGAGKAGMLVHPAVY